MRPIDADQLNSAVEKIFNNPDAEIGPWGGPGDNRPTAGIETTGKVGRLPLRIRTVARKAGTVNGPMIEQTVELFDPFDNSLAGTTIFVSEEYDHSIQVSGSVDNESDDLDFWVSPKGEICSNDPVSPKDSVKIVQRVEGTKTPASRLEMHGVSVLLQNPELILDRLGNLRPGILPYVTDIGQLRRYR